MEYDQTFDNHPEQPRPSMKHKIFTLLSTLITLSLVGALLLLLLADINQYKGLISEKVKELTGRELTIKGDLRLKPSLSPTVTAEQIQFANAPWASTPTLLSARKMELELALFPLLSGEVQIKRMEARDTKLNLQTNQSGQGNWELPGMQESAESHPLQQLERVAFHNLDLNWRNGKTGSSERFRLKRVVADKTHWGAPLHLTLNGALNGEPLQLKGEVSRHGSGQRNIQVSHFQAQLGESDLSGEFKISWKSSGRPFLSGDFHSQRLHLGLPRNQSAEEKKKRARIFSQTPLGLSGLKRLDAQIGYRADRVSGAPLAISKLTTRANLANGTVTFDPLQFHTAQTLARGTLQINGAMQPPQSHLRLEAADMAVGELFRSSLGEDTLSATGDLSVDLKGRGDSPAAIMSSLHGHSRLLAGKGTIGTASLDKITGGLQTVLDLVISPGARITTMNCLASDFQINNGIATSRAFLVDSTHSTLFGDGNINLQNERVKFVIHPKPKSATLNLAVPVEIGGTLSHPTYSLEKVSVARKAIGVVGIFAFPPAALLGLGELGTGKENPCLEIASGEGIPTNQDKDVLERGSEVIKDTVEGVGDTLKKIF
jgi:uncharacterized protein involved in outer membrane biogenesis